MKGKIAGCIVLMCATVMMGGCSLASMAYGDAETSAENSKQFHFTSSPQNERKTSGETVEKITDGDTALPVQKKQDQESVNSSASAGIDGVIQKADRLAMMYDYDKALALVQEQPGYQTDTRLKEAAQRYQQQKDSCVEYPIEQITHIFYHTLIKDTAKAFDGDSKEAGYNQVMTTIDEFNKITQSMYEKGYVMVSLHDMATVNEDGTMSRGKILLPPGKKPFVLSQDDVSYYHYMDGDGMASKLVLDENGQVKAQYCQDDGSVITGDYDLVPLIDEFVRQHPDFSYRGRKGILAMTGYNGVLGYRTDIAYKTGENLDQAQQEFLNSHPDFNYEEEVRQAKKVADAMKENGWEFASHTWGHRNAASDSPEKLQQDNEKWEAYVAPVLGKTDMIIFAFGADIGDWQNYAADNPKYQYYKSRGYRYYCNVDSSQYWVQMTGEYLRQGRRNLDGYRLYYNPDMLSDLFDAGAVFDPARPTPVPPM